LAWSGPVRRPKILLRGSRCWLGAVLKPASIEPLLQSVIDYGNRRCGWGRSCAAPTHILNELGPGSPAEGGSCCIKDGRNRPWTRLADSPNQRSTPRTHQQPHHPVEIESTALYHCDQYEAHASSMGGSRRYIEAGIKIGEPVPIGQVGPYILAPGTGAIAAAAGLRSRRRCSPI